MKLLCDKHRHRVHVLKVPTVCAGVDSGYESDGLAVALTTKIIVVHRKDGLHCDSTFLRMSRAQEAEVFTKEMVADLQPGLGVSALAGYKEPKRRSSRNKKHVYAVRPFNRETITLPSL